MMKRQPSRTSMRVTKPSGLFRSDSMYSTTFMPPIHKQTSIISSNNDNQMNLHRQRSIQRKPSFVNPEYNYN